MLTAFRRPAGKAIVVNDIVAAEAILGGQAQLGEIIDVDPTRRESGRSQFHNTRFRPFPPLFPRHIGLAAVTHDQPRDGTLRAEADQREHRGMAVSGDRTNVGSDVVEDRGEVIQPVGHAHFLEGNVRTRASGSLARNLSPGILGLNPRHFEAAEIDPVKPGKTLGLTEPGQVVRAEVKE